MNLLRSRNVVRISRFELTIVLAVFLLAANTGLFAQPLTSLNAEALSDTPPSITPAILGANRLPSLPRKLS